MKRKIFNIIQISNCDSGPSWLFNVVISCAIFANIAVVFLSTFGELSGFRPVFVWVEISTVAVFCIEYALRIWTADILYPDRRRCASRVRFLFSYDGIVDLLTILPAFFLSGFVAFRMLRVVRVFHLFRLNANYDSFNVITSVLKEKKNQIASSVFIILVLMMASSLCMYSIEHEAQPDVFKNAFSGMWYSAATLLTIGYGDIYPVTVLGRVFGMFTSFLGVGLVAIPTGIISAGFVENYHRKSELAMIHATDVKDILEIPVDGSLAGKDVDDLDSLDVFLVIRGDLSVLPKDGLILKHGDVVIAKKKS